MIVPCERRLACQSPKPTVKKIDKNYVGEKKVVFWRVGTNRGTGGKKQKKKNHGGACDKEKGKKLTQALGLRKAVPGEVARPDRAKTRPESGKAQEFLVAL